MRMHLKVKIIYLSGFCKCDFSRPVINSKIQKCYRIFQKICMHAHPYLLSVFILISLDCSTKILCKWLKHEQKNKQQYCSEICIRWYVIYDISLWKYLQKTLQKCCKWLKHGHVLCNGFFVYGALMVLNFGKEFKKGRDSFKYFEFFTFYTVVIKNWLIQWKYLLIYLKFQMFSHWDLGVGIFNIISKQFLYRTLKTKWPIKLGKKSYTPFFGW